LRIGALQMSAPLWYPSANLDAQFAHVGWGALLVSAVALDWRAARRPLGLAPVWAGVGLTLVYAAAKEFAFDVLVEGDGLRNGAVDFSFYCVGIAVAIGLRYGWKKMRRKC
jgi:hypothetical protein